MVMQTEHMVMHTAHHVMLRAGSVALRSKAHRRIYIHIVLICAPSHTLTRAHTHTAHMAMPRASSVAMRSKAHRRLSKELKTKDDIKSAARRLMSTHTAGSGDGGASGDSEVPPAHMHHTHTCMHACMHACMYTCNVVVYVQTHTHIRTPTCIYTLSRTPTPPHTHTRRGGFELSRS